MNASLTFSNQLLKLIFQNDALPYLGNAAGLQPSSVAGNVYLRLCTDATTPDASTPGTECAYPGYVTGGVAVPRSTDNWTDDGNEVSVSEVLFGTAGSGASENIDYVEIWKNNSSNDEAYRIGFIQLETTLAITEGKTPRFATGKLTLTLE
jgi:hypothetical protein